MLLGMLKVGVNVGTAVIVKVVTGPVHGPSLAVTLIVAICVVVTLAIVKAGMVFPVPLEAKPIFGLLLDHLKVTPLDNEVNTIGKVALLPHTCWLLTGFTLGEGQFDTTQFVVPPVAQVLPIGVIVKVTLSPGFKPLTVKLVVPETKVPVVGIPLLTV